MVVQELPPKVTFENPPGMEKNTMRRSINEGILEDLDEEDGQVYSPRKK